MISPRAKAVSSDAAPSLVDAGERGARAGLAARVRDRSVDAAQPLPTLVINLDRSKDRWRSIVASAQGTDLLVERVTAVDGRNVAGRSRIDIDRTKFRNAHGREMLDGEYGCYRSHLNALGLVARRGYDIAIIAEDDVLLNDDLARRVRSIFKARPGIDVLKLVNHRASAFIKAGASEMRDDFGRCLHGPQGSAACYAVTARSARKLVDALRVMSLPFDIALERGWANGTNTFTTRHPLVTFQGNQAETTIATRDQYRNSKLPKVEQLGVLSFRAADYARRVVYSLQGKSA